MQEENVKPNSSLPITASTHLPSAKDAHAETIIVKRHNTGNRFLTFFSDSKNVFSLIAILISLASFYYTYTSQREQNKRWDALNLARIELIEQGFLVWKELSEHDASSVNWGYEPTLVQLIEGRKYRGRYQLLNSLSLIDIDTKTTIANSTHGYTLSDAVRELQRLGLFGNNRVDIMRQYQMAFDLKNMGAAEATNMRVNVSVSSSIPGLNGELVQSDQDLNIPPNGTFNAPVHFFVPRNQTLKDTLTFTINVTYKRANGEQAVQHIVSSYDSNRNFWHMGGRYT